MIFLEGATRRRSTSTKRTKAQNSENNKKRFEEIDLAVRSTQAMIIQHQEEIDELKVLVERQNRVLDNEPLLYKNSLGVELDLVNDIDGHSCNIYGRNLARFVWPNKEYENYRIADENKKKSSRPPFSSPEDLEKIKKIKGKLLIIFYTL